MTERETSPEQPKSYEQLERRLGEKLDLAETLGLQTGLLVVDPGAKKVVATRNETTPMFAASVNKLAIARTVHDTRPDGFTETIDLESARFATGGGRGAFDQPNRPGEATVADLYADMLVPSGNAAAIALVDWLGGPEVVNAHMQELGLSRTHLEVRGEGFHFGETTPADALRLLIASDPRQNLPHTIARLLLQNPDTDGIRTYLAGSDSLQVANKSGAWSHPDDGDFRHEVGLLLSGDKALLFAVFLHSPPSNRAKLLLQKGVAKRTLGQIGADLGEAIGDQPLRSKWTVGGGAVRSFFNRE